MTYRIKGWAKFQHFKDRRPPWIKLYRDILDDVEWHELDSQAAKALVMLWLIASEEEGNLPDLKKLAFRLRMSESKVSDLLSKLSHWLEQDDIDAISDRHQSDAPETEGETKKEKEGAPALLSAKEIPEDLARDFLAIRRAKKSPLTATALAGIEREAAAAGYTLEKALRECCARGWQGFKAEWVLPKGKPADAVHTTVPTNPAAIFVPEPRLTPEQLAANRQNAARALAGLTQQLKVKH